MRRPFACGVIAVALLLVDGPLRAQSGPLDEAAALHEQALQFYQQGRYADAVPPARRALAIREAALGPEDVYVAQSLNTLALPLDTMGRRDEAEPLYRRSLAIQEKVLGLGHPNVAAVLDNLARLFDAQGRYDEAGPLYRRALAIREKALPPDHPDVANSLNNLAGLSRAQGHYREAEPLYRRALAIREKALTPEHPNLATSLNNLAGLFRAQGRFGEAEPLYRRALAIWEKARGPDHLDVALSLNNLAVLFREQGRYGEAEPLYRRALAIREKTLGAEHPDVANSLNNLAALLEAEGRYGEAEPLFRRSLAIAENTLGPEHPAVARLLTSLARLLRARGRDDETEPLYRRSLAALEKSLGPGHPDMATALDSLAGLLTAKGRHGEAELTFRRALAIREKALGHEHPDVAKSLNNLAGMFYAQQRYGEAYADARRAIVILEKRALASPGEDGSGREGERRSHRVFFINFLAAAAAYAAEVPDRRDTVAAEAFAAAQLAGQSSADRALAQSAVRFATASDALAKTVRERQDTVGRLAALNKAIVAAVSQSTDRRSASREQAIREEIAALGLGLETIDARLAESFPEFAELSNPRPLAMDAARKLLSADEALLSFAVADDAIYRFVLRADRSEFRRIEATRGALEDLVGALRIGLDTTGLQSISALNPYPAARAHELYALLFAGTAPLLAGARRLLIVPDAVLGGLPFSVLPTRPPAKDTGYRQIDWLARDHAITVLPSVGSLQALRVFAARAAGPREPFLGFGDPDLTGRPGDLKGRQQVLARLVARGMVADLAEIRALAELPDTADELRRIASALKADPVASVKLRRQATETQVKAADLSRYRVLAFATHGLMAGDFKGYGEPALVLTPPERGDELDDGLLGATEVAQLRLNADWVILSACNTAAPDGTPGAEGLSGLARAFFYAGSRALLVSHWPVLSDASVRLTTGAIERLSREPGIGRAEALRQSMLALLDDDSAPAEYAHPAIWAPFSLVGEGGTGR